MPKAVKKEIKKTTKKAVSKTSKKPVSKTTKQAAPKPAKKVAAKPAKPATAKATAGKKVTAKKPVKSTVAAPKKKAAAKAPKFKDKALKALIETIVDGMQDVKGKNIVILDLTSLPNAVTDYFVIATGDSSTQVESMASAVVRKTRKELKEKPWHEEGVGNSEWILLDYINVVVHIFYRETREFYNLEDLWADADRTDIANLD